MATTIKIRKRCLKCGVERDYQPRIRHCREQKMGPSSYWCYGALEVVKPAEQKAPAERRRPQDVARRKLLATERAIDAVNDEVFKLAKRLGTLSARSRALSKRASRYAAIAGLSDAEIEQQRQQRIEREQRRKAAGRTRKIELEEEA